LINKGLSKVTYISLLVIKIYLIFLWKIQEWVLRSASWG